MIAFVSSISRFTARTSAANFDVLRGRYFPGGPTPPEGLDSEHMFKVCAVVQASLAPPST